MFIRLYPLGVYPGTAKLVCVVFLSGTTRTLAVCGLSGHDHDRQINVCLPVASVPVHPFLTWYTSAAAFVPSQMRDSSGLPPTRVQSPSFQTFHRHRGRLRRFRAQLRRRSWLPPQC